MGGKNSKQEEFVVLTNTGALLADCKFFADFDGNRILEGIFHIPPRKIIVQFKKDAEAKKYKFFKIRTSTFTEATEDELDRIESDLFVGSHLFFRRKPSDVEEGKEGETK